MVNMEHDQLNALGEVVRQLVPDLYGPNQQQAVAALTAISDDLETRLLAVNDAAATAQVASWAAPLWRYWVLCGRIRRGIDVLSQLQHHADQSKRPPLAAARAVLHYFAGDDDAYADLAHRELSDGVPGDPETAGLLLLVAGWAAQAGNRLDEADESVAQAARLFTAANHRWGHAVATLTRGEIARAAGRWKSAADLYERSLADYQRLGDPAAISACLFNLGLVARHNGDLTAARAYFTAAAESARAGHVDLFLASDLLALAALDAAVGDTVNAATLLKESDALFARLGAQPEPADRTLRAEVLTAMHDIDPLTPTQHIDS